MRHQERDRQQTSLTEFLNFPEDSLGKSIADFLEGRERPPELFSVSLEEVPRSRTYLTPSLLVDLEKGGVVTVFDLLSRSEEELNEIPEIGPTRLRKIQEWVDECFFEKVRITPEMRLLAKIFDFKEWLLDLLPEGERELKDDLNRSLDLLDEEKRRVLELRFGLDGWEGRTRRQVGLEMGLTKEQIRNLDEKALRFLRLPPRSMGLRKYVASLSLL